MPSTFIESAHMRDGLVGQLNLGDHSAFYHGPTYLQISGMKQIIFTADDFGLCTEVNEAVERAHTHGVLSAASLMVAAPSTADAVARARLLPRLKVGLHLTLVDGKPLLPADDIPTLVNAQGSFSSDLFAAGVRWFFSAAARRDLAKEIDAQFQAFRATGLTLDHVNAHNHMHLHPTVLGMILARARDFGVTAVRLPAEPPQPGLAPWLWLMRRRIRHAGLASNDVLVGLRHSGHMTEARVLAALDRLQDGINEFYFHPATATTPALETAAPGYNRMGELQALTSRPVAQRLEALGLIPVGFGDLAPA
jgi:chitin disaccharide deacetylase